MTTRRSLFVYSAGLMMGLATGTPLFAQAAPPALSVVASFSILADLARQIGGERVKVETIVGPNQDAHVFKPSPADAAKLTGAGLIAVVGLGYDSFMGRLARSAASKAPLVTLSTGIKPLKQAGSGHSHDHGHGHAHGKAGEDPHVWQSITNVRQMVTTLARALAAADPAGAATYDKNLATYLGRLEALDAELRAMLASLPADRREFATTHDAFGYLARDYGLTIRSLQGISTDSEPSAADLARIIRQLKASKTPAVFLENVTDPRKMQRIAAESSARIGGTLYSDSLSLADGPVPTYIDLMRHNVSTIVAALKP